MVGRPRKTSVDDLLEQAATLFWANGYDATSMGDLTKALGVGPSSLYNTFGSKAGLYIAAIEAYADREGSFYTESLGLPDIHEALSQLLLRSAQVYTREECPRGCAILSQGPSVDHEVEEHMRERRIQARQRVADRIRAAVDQQQLPQNTNVDALARFVTGVLQGLSQQARDGASRDALTAMAHVAVHALHPPESASP